MRLWLLPTSSEIHRDREIHLFMRMEAKPDKFICVDMVTVLKKKKKGCLACRDSCSSLMANTDLTTYYFS